MLLRFTIFNYLKNKFDEFILIKKEKSVMEKQWLFLDKENYEDVLKYQGDPRCYTCLVRAMCFNVAIDEDYYYEIILKRPCDEANVWFKIAEYFGDFIYGYKDMPVGLLGIGDIKKIIQLGENENIEDLARKFGVSNSAMEAFEYFVNELHVLLSTFYEDEIIQGLIEPLVEDQSKMLEEKKT